MEETPIDLSSLDISDHRMEAIKREMRSKAHLKPLSSFQFHYLPFHGHFIFEDSQVEFNYDNKGHIVKLPPYEPAPYYSEQDEYPSLEEFTAEPVKFDLPAYEEVDPLSILMTQTSNKSLTHKRTLRQFLQGHKNSFSLRHLYLHSA